MPPITETYLFDNLLVADDFITDTATLVLGQNLLRGAALGKVTATGKLAQLDSTKVDGTQTPYAVLAADTDATAADKACGVYKFGEFNQAKIGFIGADTFTTMKEGFRAVGIFLKATIPA